ncbi:MAG: WXG100 family type VII secretion target [Lachnospiraceae bacterium]|nr:WXG100 family type VII secretion target [Lachnospiraceae bacterium]
MAYENEVRQQRQLLSQTVGDVKRKRQQMQTVMNDASRWWKGKGGETFIHAYRDIDQDAAQFVRYLERAVDGLERLPSLIARAERERREKEK